MTFLHGAISSFTTMLIVSSASEVLVPLRKLCMCEFGHLLS